MYVESNTWFKQNIRRVQVKRITTLNNIISDYTLIPWKHPQLYTHKVYTPYDVASRILTRLHVHEITLSLKETVTKTYNAVWAHNTSTESKKNDDNIAGHIKVLEADLRLVPTQHPLHYYINVLWPCYYHQHIRMLPEWWLACVYMKQYYRWRMLSAQNTSTESKQTDVNIAGHIRDVGEELHLVPIKRKQVSRTPSPIH